MQVERTHASGAEEWHCPACGRRMLVKWHPRFRRIVIEEGDATVAHSGLRVDRSVLSPVAAPRAAEESELAPEDHARLAAWEAWLSDVDFDNRPAGDD